ncbi:MAG: TetR/AcrR family transcriptional regulator [Ktedonobacteraceae bacterium]|nr:TetR/AcrR family transcriptional regulator [Ktedonobacteraceae bacterium]
MSPRPYKLGQRQAASEQTRSRIITAAREILMASDGFASFSIDQVARQADVARMTVYHQFGSKSGLLEALCDSLAASGGMEQIATAFRQPNPLDVLNEYLHIFSRFWDADRLVTRRLRALAALDPDFEQVICARDERRRQGVRVITERLVQQQVLPPDAPLDEIVAILFTLSSFETFEALAGPAQGLQEVAPLVCRLAGAALQINASIPNTGL